MIVFPALPYTSTYETLPFKIREALKKGPPRLLNIDRNRGNSFESHVVPEVYQREVRIPRVESLQNFLECSVPAQEHQVSLTVGKSKGWKAEVVFRLIFLSNHKINK